MSWRCRMGLHDFNRWSVWFGGRGGRAIRQRHCNRCGMIDQQVAEVLK